MKCKKCNKVIGENEKFYEISGGIGYVCRHCMPNDVDDVNGFVAYSYSNKQEYISILRERIENLINRMNEISVDKRTVELCKKEVEITKKILKDLDTIESNIVEMNQGVGNYFEQKLIEYINYYGFYVNGDTLILSNGIELSLLENDEVQAIINHNDIKLKHTTVNPKIIVYVKENIDKSRQSNFIDIIDKCFA